MKNKDLEFTEEICITKDKKVSIKGETLSYQITTGRLPIKNENGEIEAQIFFVYYKKNTKEQRPLTFAFNGGPGSPAIWLHLGLGPKRVKMTKEGFFPTPPFSLIDNEETWLPKTDLVFIDPVGCGYSEAKSDKEKFFSPKGDVESMGEFIRTFLNRFNRWNAPLFLAGESYGGFRVAGLAKHLFPKGIAFNGIIFISAALNFYTLQFSEDYRLHDLPYVLMLPSYTASAWFHQKLPKETQDQDIKSLLKKVETWSQSKYTHALMLGDNLSQEEENDLAEKLHKYTGVAIELIKEHNFRLPLNTFCLNLLRTENKTIGRLDTRVVGLNTYQNTVASLTGDPSLTDIIPPFNTCFYQYVREELGYKTDLQYQNLTGVTSWKWEEGLHDDSSQDLQKAMAWNPYLKIYFGCGYYDLATPYFAMDYTLSHMRLDKIRKENICMHYYEAGHMYYIHEKSRCDFQKHIYSFIDSAL